MTATVWEGRVFILGIPELALVLVIIMAISVLAAWICAPVADHLVVGDEPVLWVRAWELLTRRDADLPGPDSTRLILAGVMTVGFSVVVWKTPVSAWPAFGCLVIAMALLAVIDWRTNRLPDVITLPTFITTLLGLSFSSIMTDSLGKMIAAFIGCLSALILYGIFIAVNPAGLGWGDFKLSGVLGFALGWLGLGEYILGMTSAFLFAGFYSLTLLLARKIGFKDGIPLGPWMVAGAFFGIGAGGILIG